jgi:hypothetical protein
MYALLATARRFAAGRMVGASSGSDASRSLEAARFFERALVARFLTIGCSSVPEVGGDSTALIDAGALNIGDTLVVVVPEVEDGDTRWRADRRVARRIAVREDFNSNVWEQEYFFGAW